MTEYVLGSNGDKALICETGSTGYIPDPVRHQYGVSSRLPIERMLISEIDFARDRFPDHQIFTLGTSCISGERFLTHLTVCELELEPDSIEELQRAVNESDQAIRRKPAALWKWDMCMASKEHNHAALFIGWFDFAYFAQHRNEFMNFDHNHYMSSFSAGRPVSTDYKIMHDGSISEFDESKLDEEEKSVLDNPHQVSFREVEKSEIGDRGGLSMV